MIRNQKEDPGENVENQDNPVEPFIVEPFYKRSDYNETGTCGSPRALVWVSKCQERKYGKDGKSGSRCCVVNPVIWQTCVANMTYFFPRDNTTENQNCNKTMEFSI